MECRVPVRRFRESVALLALSMLLPAIAMAERTAVLVTGEKCPIADIDSLDVRKAYLGVLVDIDGYHIRPLRLSGDEQLNRVFFQTIVAMSRKSYERRVLSLALKFGTPRPAEFDNLDEALDVVRRVECGVVYAWAGDLADKTGIRTLKPLWRGQ